LKKADIVRMKQTEHILSEKEVLSQIHHPFIVNLLKTFQDTKRLYMILEYVVGGEVFSHLRKAGKFPSDVAKFYAAEIILALEYLHSLDIAYRDLKPENLLLDSQGHVKITDFGFAKKVTERTFTLCGTPEYLAPEIIQSKGHGKAVDWWALGILIYEMIVGQPPFCDEEPMGIYQKILAGKIYFPKYFDRNAKALVKKLVTADLSKRYGNLKAGSDDIIKHKWFADIDQDKMLKGEMKSPYQVNVKDDNDVSNFENIPDSAELPPAVPASADPFTDW
jgi:serine/threonine protein kinase